MYEELVKRLRENAARFDYDGWVDTAVILEEAADSIENVSKAYQMMAEAYEAEVTKPRWIPVTERLPECEKGTEVGNIEWINCGMVFAMIAFSTHQAKSLSDADIRFARSAGTSG